VPALAFVTRFPRAPFRTGPALVFEAAAAADPEVHTFQVRGDDVSDYAAVQAHIVTLETALGEIRKLGRVDYVKSLGEDGKIAAPQVEEMTKHAASLTDDQFTQFKATYDAMPKSSLFVKHGGKDNAGEPSTPASATVALAGSDADKAVVAEFRSGGMSEENIAKTDAGKRLASAAAAA